MKQLILGGARSGKSRLALQYAEQSGLELVFIATATASDEEMAIRIAAHQDGRNSAWRLVEEPVALAKVLEQNANESRCIVVDCLTLWLSNLIGHNEHTSQASFEQQRNDLIQCIPALSGHIIFVSNELGMGLVPGTALGRHFRDELGRLHQDIAAICDCVILTIAGIPQILKGER
ncbi:MAG TPA: bifunctional adenosylcobinamide kinase/adenosylcobinamide-phosphate guanylyltransferase [Acidiferrobacteraceae bacterium]|nr:bifunctional adenosylcobinamide kinase/adenosylcobinamide-phosphate guanylyltransferase [Acidiferrobacteraceae bacterium]HEX19978.1 bifunctional adenosylcobinamide kinase/adenosylcobinamide-phosphate guanylyltransferase [Acidiferrobacteraceae bacterium]